MDRSKNTMADLLANVAIMLNDISFSDVSKIEIQNMTSIPDNIENWHVFENDKDILNLLLNEDKYHG